MRKKRRKKRPLKRLPLRQVSLEDFGPRTSDGALVIATLAELRKHLEMTDATNALTILGRYELTELIHAGAGTLVFRGIDRKRRHRAVVVKVYYDPFHDAPTYVAGEAALLRKLKHPMTPALLDSGLVEERYPFLVMHARGQGALHRFMPLSLQGLLAICGLIAVSLHTICRRVPGFIHGDIKPANLLFEQTPTGPRIVWIDMPLATWDGDTHTPRAAGTTPFFAPERAVRRLNQDGERPRQAEDIFALGVVFYRFATFSALGGAAEADESNEVIIQRHAQGAHLPQDAIDRLRASPAPPVFQELVLRMLSTRPEDRPTIDTIVTEIRTAWAALDAQQERSP